MKDYIFNFSDKYLEKKSQLFNLLKILSPFIISVFIFFSSYATNIHIYFKIFSILIYSSIIEVILFILPKVIFKNLRQITIKATEEFIERTDGRFASTVDYSDIKKVVVNRNQNDEILLIKIYSSNSGTLHISTVKNMNVLLEKVNRHLSESVNIITKKTTAFWNNPVVVFAIIVIITSIILSIDKFGGKVLYESFNNLFLTLVGILLVVYRPITKYSGDRFKIFELLCGYVLLFSGISFLILDVIALING